MTTAGPAEQKKGYIVVRESIANVYKNARRRSRVSKCKALVSIVSSSSLGAQASRLP